MLSKLGAPWSLAAAPLASACLMAATAVFPNTIMIGVAEILRKVKRRYYCSMQHIIKLFMYYANAPTR